MSALDKLIDEALDQARRALDFYEDCADQLSKGGSGSGGAYDSLEHDGGKLARDVMDCVDKAIDHRRAFQSAEPQAVRHSFDGEGWLYQDSGNGSDWYVRAMRYPDAEPLYAQIVSCPGCDGSRVVSTTDVKRGGGSIEMVCPVCEGRV